MSSRIQVKICGIKTSAALRAAVRGGAGFIGLVFHPASPRALSIEAAGALRRELPREVKAVALIVDAPDELLMRISGAVDPDLFQLHGAETPKRVAEIRERMKRPVIKAIGLSREEDLEQAPAFERAADFLLFDAKAAGAPAGAPAGGAGASFDWKLLAGRAFAKPWFLSGGLNAENVTEAVHISGARLLDVSSGVERERGEKDPALVSAFLDTVRRL
jgi:phosphoribosylanthranilate isomerase